MANTIAFAKLKKTLRALTDVAITEAKKNKPKLPLTVIVTVRQ